MEILNEALGTALGTAFLGFIAFFYREKIKYLFSKDLEKIKKSLEMLSSTSHVFDEDSKNAIKKYWESIIEINEYYSKTIGIFDLISIKSVEKINKNKDYNSQKFCQNIEDAIRSTSFNEINIIIKNKSLNELRPFVGEALWRLQKVFSIIIFRPFLEYKNKYEKGENLVHWKNDDELIDILKSVLTEKELKFIFNNESYQIAKILEILEQKILKELSKKIYGFSHTEKLLENAELLFKIK
ncbi:TPA: hypothetical protein EYG96_01925 [Candidatus Gracilibacteria bacterium]|nr:hypothetical protein [Candidatus Peregrinibacteria bacterium]HIQ56781.1 hypothetical protein [Candidatus Gracilibacteria bacterium]